MTPTLLFWLCIMAAAVLLIAAAAGGFGLPIVLILVAAGIGALVLAVVSRLRAQGEATRTRSEKETVRYAELKSQIATTGTRVVVTGSSGIWMLVLMVAITLASLYYLWLAPGIRSVLLTVFLALITLLVYLVVWPAFRKPVLVVRPEGIETHGYGSFTWTQIDGMDLRAQKSEGAPVNHFLDLRIPDLASYAAQMNGVVRWIRRLVPAARRTQHISIRVSGTSESPAVIHRLCRDLWTAATGKDHLWYAGMSEQNFQLLAKGREQLAALERVEEAAATDPELAIKLLAELEKAQPAMKNRKTNVVTSSASFDELTEKLRQMKQRNPEWEQRANEIAKAQLKTRSITWAVTIVVVLLMLVGIYGVFRQA